MKWKLISYKIINFLKKIYAISIDSDILYASIFVSVADKQTCSFVGIDIFEGINGYLFNRI